VPRVDKIVRPPATPTSPPPSGWCFGDVGIDSIAGPTEVVIMADDSAEPSWIAADLLAQAEQRRAGGSDPDRARAFRGRQDRRRDGSPGDGAAATGDRRRRRCATSAW